VTTGGNAFSSGFGSVKTPMYSKSVPTPKTNAVSPFGNFIDVRVDRVVICWLWKWKNDF